MRRHPPSMRTGWRVEKWWTSRGARTTRRAGSRRGRRPVDAVCRPFTRASSRAATSIPSRTQAVTLPIARGISLADASNDLSPRAALAGTPGRRRAATGLMTTTVAGPASAAVSRRAYLVIGAAVCGYIITVMQRTSFGVAGIEAAHRFGANATILGLFVAVQLCLLYTSPSPRD